MSDLHNVALSMSCVVRRCNSQFNSISGHETWQSHWVLSFVIFDKFGHSCCLLAAWTSLDVAGSDLGAG